VVDGRTEEEAVGTPNQLEAVGHVARGLRVPIRVEQGKLQFGVTEIKQFRLGAGRGGARQRVPESRPGVAPRPAGATHRDDVGCLWHTSR